MSSQVKRKQTKREMSTMEEKWKGNEKHKIFKQKREENESRDRMRRLLERQNQGELLGMITLQSFSHFLKSSAEARH